MKTLKETIEALKFDYVNSDIVPNFTLEPIRSTAFVLYYPEKEVSTKEVEQYAQGNNLEVANLAELLAYAKDGWNDKDFVVALGSSAHVGGGRFVPCLSRVGAGRYLSLRWGDSRDWREVCRFLLVRKGAGTLEPLALNPDLGTLAQRVEKIEEWIDQWEGVGKKPFDSGWADYRKGNV